MNPETIQHPDLTAAPSASNSPPQFDSPPYGDSSSSFRDVKEVTTDQVRQVASDLKDSSTEALHTAKEASKDFVHDQKEKIAEKIDSYIEAVKVACDSMREGEANLLINPAQRASRQMEKASEYLHSREPMELLQDLGDLARRRPEIVFGTLFVAGLAAVRFLKASSRDRHESPQNLGVATARPSGYPNVSVPLHPQFGTAVAPAINQPILNPNQLK